MLKLQKPRYGLKEKWRDIIKSIERTHELYSKVNKIISLGLSDHLRKKGVRKIRGEGNFLDAGSGPGDLTKVILDSHKKSYIVCLDASYNLVKIASEKFSDEELGHIDFVLGLFENPPFREGVFEGIFSAYAIRDSVDLIKAVYRLTKTVKQGGFFIDVDIGKPMSLLIRNLLILYLDIVVPVIASFYYKSIRNPWSKLSNTVEDLPANGELKRIIQRFYEETDIEEYVFGSMIIASGFKRL